MDISVHNRILWYGCVEATKRLKNKGGYFADPRIYFPFLVRGSWMNDMNQSTLFTDILLNATDKNKAFHIDRTLKNFFRELWRIELKKLIDDMGTGSQEARNAAQTFVSNNPIDKSEVDSFGVYSRYDHLDVLMDNFRTECSNGSLRSNTIDDAINTRAGGRLLQSSFNKTTDQRLEEHRLTVLGRALHSLSDFFAHSNYVELLLWNLSWRINGRCVLDSWVTDEYNRTGEFLDRPGKEILNCPLPGSRKEMHDLLQKNIMMWYGDDPQSTPLTSCLFYPIDTVYSLLKIYAAHLERVDDQLLNDEAFNLVMAVFDIPGRVFLSKAWNVYETFRNALYAIGRAARNYLADELEKSAAGKSEQTKGIMQACAAVIRRYDNAEAKEWAKAGRLKYVAYTFERDMAAKYDDQKPENPLLPHHSLLCKDNVPSNFRDMLRYQLACMFATEVATKVIEMHFSKDTIPDETKFSDEIANKYFIHPSEQIDKQLIDVVSLNAWINKSHICSWTGLIQNGKKVVN